MFGKFLIKIVLKLLSGRRLSQENHNLLITGVLDKLVALPLRDIITYNEEGKLLVNGRSLDIEQARVLRESARNVLNSPAFKIIHDQVCFAAITIGIHKADNDKQIAFAKAAIWWGQQEIEILKLLAPSNES